MNVFHTSSFPLAAALVGCAIAACHTMKLVPPSELSSKAFTRVWITKGGNSAVLMEPQVRGDTLAGFVNGEYREMPLAEAGAVRARVPAWGRTALLGGALTATAVAALVYFENRSYVGGGSACTGAIQQQQQALLQ